SPHKMNHLRSHFFGSGTFFNQHTPRSTKEPIKNRKAANSPGGKEPFPNFMMTKLNPQIIHSIIIPIFISNALSIIIFLRNRNNQLSSHSFSVRIQSKLKTGIMTGLLTLYFKFNFILIKDFTLRFTLCLIYKYQLIKW